MKGEDKLFGAVALIALFTYFIWKVVKVLLISVGIILGLVLIIFAIEAIMTAIYFNGKTFNSLKERLRAHVSKCNELNEHIEELKYRCSDYHSQDYGQSTYMDLSSYNYRRPLHDQHRNNSPFKHFCSISVCKNAQDQPFRYLCKYFNIECNEKTLDYFGSMLNDFTAAEEGKNILLQERHDILTTYKQSIPLFIRLFYKDSFYKKLGYTNIELSNSHFQTYSFIYVSAGGNSTMTCDITMDCDNIERFIEYIATKIKISNTAKYQRSLMTLSLRNEIKARDNYTCQMCGISVKDEPHLLLEIDHIIPLSKNGVTTKNNLQTLCWQCNRKKGAKLKMVES